MKKYYTDYPFTELGDIEYKEAPIRECVILEYDGNKYCDIKVGDKEFNIKSCYIYKKPGRCGDVENVSNWILNKYRKK